MAFTDYKDFFDSVRSINNEYLKPADTNIKFLEEYLGENAIICVDLLKNAYAKLIKAIQPGNVLSNKGTIDADLEKYKNNLQIILIKTYFALIDVRKKDLQENIHKDAAANVEKIIKAEKAELAKILLEKKDKKDVLDAAIKRSKAIFDIIEKECAKYHLA